MRNKIKNNAIDILIIVLCFVSSGLISIFLGQSSNWDLRNYHFYNAYAFLSDRLTYDIAPAQLQTFHNPLLDIPFYLMITHLKPIVYGFLIGGLQGINIWLIYKIAYLILRNTQEIKRHLLSLAAGITGYYGAANISEIGTTFQDNITSLFVLGAIALVVSSIQQSKTQQVSISKKGVVVSACIIGCATGLKLPVATYALPFVLSLLLIGSSWKDRIVNTLISGLSTLIGIIITLGYWMTVLWKNFNNPIFPYYNKFFKSPYYDFINFSDTRFLPRDLFQILFYPLYFLKEPRLVSEAGFRDVRLALCYILFALFLYMVFYKWMIRKYGHQEFLIRLEHPDSFKNSFHFIIFFFVISYILWQNMFSIYRYLLPLELLSPVFIILIIKYIFPFQRVFMRLSLGIFIFIILTMSPMNWGRVAWSDNYFGVELPPIKKIDHATIIMAGDDPLSYVIPFFPKGTRFVNVKSNFIKPSSSKLWHEKIKMILQDQSTDNTYLLYRGNNQKIDYEKILKLYNLRVPENKYKKLYSRFDDNLYLVPVLRDKY
jgi:hypothetical protein